MNRDYKVADKGFFENLLIDDPNMPIEIEGTKEGYIVYGIDRRSKNRYLLHNVKRNNVRRFKSPGTLFRFLTELGVTDLKVVNLHLAEPDSYVRNNSIRHLRPDRVKDKQTVEPIQHRA